MCSVSRTILSLQRKDSQVVETRTSGQTFEGLVAFLMLLWLLRIDRAHLLLQMWKQIKIPKAGSMLTPNPKVLGPDVFPQAMRNLHFNFFLGKRKNISFFSPKNQYLVFIWSCI